MTTPDTIEGWPPLSTGRSALAPDGTTYTYQPNVPGGLIPAVTPSPPDLEGYPRLTTTGVGVDPDGATWLYHPPSGGMIDLTPDIPPPSNTVPPTIQIVSGNPTPGQTAINSSMGTWVPPPVPGNNVRRQWYLSGVAIPGATANNYVIQEADVGGGLQCGNVATGDGGSSEVAMSNTLTIVAAPPEDAPAAANRAKSKKKR